MKARRLELNGRNTGLLKEAPISKSCVDDDCGYVSISRGRFSRCGRLSPLIGRDSKYFYRNHSLKYNKKIVYGFNEFGTIEDGTLVFVAFNRFQHQRFLWIQREHWLQKEENIRYMVNVIFLVIGAYLGYKSLS